MKRLLTIVLTLAVALTYCLPMSVFAAESSEDAPADPEIYVVQIADGSSASLPADGGDVTFDVMGRNLTEESVIFGVKRYDGTSYRAFDAGAFTETVLPGAKSGRVQVEVHFPANSTGADIRYQVTFKSGIGQTPVTANAEIVIAGKTEVAAAKVTSASILPASVKDKTSTGGRPSAHLSVSGEGLTANNWGVNVKVFYDENCSVEASGKALPEYTMDASGADIEFPINTMKSKLYYQFVIGAKVGGSIQADQTLVVAQNGNTDTTKYVSELPTAVSGSGQSITAEFDHAHTAKVSMEALRSHVYIASVDGVTDRHMLDDKDTLELNGTTMTITIGGDYAVSASSYLFIDKGALTCANGESPDAIKFYISKAPMVHNVTFDHDVLDAKGGLVTATIHGSNLSGQSISGKLFVGNDSTASDIEVVSTKGGSEPEVQFVLPENRGDKTITYRLNLHIGETPQYGGAKNAAVVAVLPAGEAVDAQTLGDVTITGSSNETVDPALQNKVYTKTINTSETSVKINLGVNGTRLTEKDTVVRLIDEEGVVWRVNYDAQCTGTVRFHSVIGTYANGVVGEGNYQEIEILPPSRLGRDHEYTFEIALDGKHFLPVPDVKLIVRNNGLIDADDGFNKEELSTLLDPAVIVRYVDAEGKDIASRETYKGYGVTELVTYPIAAKEISGYVLVSSPNAQLLRDGFVRDLKRADYTLTYTYKKAGSAAANIDLKKYTPSKVKSLKLKGGKKKATVTWKKNTKLTTGYQIRYGVKKNFKQSKLKTVKGTRTQKAVIKKLKSKKYYYVKIRAYKTVKVNGKNKNVYSSWSTVKRVKIK